MWIVFSLLAALTTATVVTLSKAGIKNVPSALAFAIQSVLIIAVAWGTVAWQGLWPEVARIERKSWLILVVAGVLTGLSSLLSFKALSLGDASRVSPLTNVALVFSVTLAAIFLKERLTWQVVSGALLMAGGALVIATSKPADKGETDKKNGRPESGAAIQKANASA